MTVRTKILAACLLFVAIIASVGGLAQQQGAQMGRLAISIYDHAFMGMSYVDQAEQQFLRLEAVKRDPDATLAGNEQLKKVLTLLDVALDRAAAEHTQKAGQQTRKLLTALTVASAADLPEQIQQADRSLAQLVKKFASDGLETRDDAEELATHSTRLVMIQIGIAIGLALIVGALVGHNLSQPLVQLVKVLSSLAAGNLEQPVPPKLVGRRDEIGALARAAGVFREAMQQNARADEDREQTRQANEQEKVKALHRTADLIETETNKVAARSIESGALLANRAQELTASTARMLGSIGSANTSSNEALSSCQIVAAAGEELTASAREIANQIAASATEIASTARAGTQAGQIIDQLSASMGQIGSVARLISDIAGRTNLLALNATIEAARAGEAGRGFAVVASEVKTLARQTAASTNEIASSVNAIQAATRDAVKVVGEMVERVAAIDRITQAIATAAEEQMSATGEIARNVLGTVDAMRVVSGQMEAVNAEAHHTDKAVGELQSAADGVSEQITELRGAMVRIVRASSEAADRRGDERVSLGIPAILLINAVKYPITCINLSRGGARIQAETKLPTGTDCILRLTGLPDLPGKILNEGNEAGVQFTWSIEAAPTELQTWLSQKAA